MPLTLTDRDEAMLAGAHGPAAALAMRIMVRMAALIRVGDDRRRPQIGAELRQRAQQSRHLLRDVLVRQAEPMDALAPDPQHRQRPIRLLPTGGGIVLRGCEAEPRGIARVARGAVGRADDLGEREPG